MARPGLELERALVSLPSWQVRTATLVVCLVLNMLPWPSALWAPDFVGNAVVAWNLLAPGSVGLAVSWVLGLVVDVQRGTPLGLHAFTYSLLCAGSIVLQRRLVGFSLGGRLAHVAGLFGLVFALEMLVRGLMEGRYSLLMVVAQTLIACLVWLGMRSMIYRLSLRRKRPQRIRPDTKQP